jgi:hypothetical protein
MRYICSPNETEPFVHCTFLGTKQCLSKASDTHCTSESQVWIFPQVLGGICLRCVHRLYPEYFNRIQQAYPETYASLLGHDSLPINDALKRAMLMYDLVCNLYIAQLVNTYLSSGGQLKDQTIYQKDCHVIQDAQGLDAQPFLGYGDMISQFISHGEPTQENEPPPIPEGAVAAATWAGMERWMAMFHRNASEMDKAFEQLKQWRFEEPPRDDVFEQSFRITDMLNFTILEAENTSMEF